MSEEQLRLIDRLVNGEDAGPRVVIQFEDRIRMIDARSQRNPQFPYDLENYGLDIWAGRLNPVMSKADSRKYADLSSRILKLDTQPKGEERQAVLEEIVEEKKMVLFPYFIAEPLSLNMLSYPFLRAQAIMAIDYRGPGQKRKRLFRD